MTACVRWKGEIITLLVRQRVLIRVRQCWLRHSGADDCPTGVRIKPSATGSIRQNWLRSNNLLS